MPRYHLPAMYLKALYRYHKLYFAAAILFIAGQLFINYTWGVVVSPFFNYGMYSHKMKPQQTYAVFEVWVNGERLEGSDFSPWEWDKVVQPLVFYKNIDSSNHLYVDQVSRIAGYAGWQPRQERFVQPCNYKGFSAWYKQYLGSFVKPPVNDVQVLLRTYNYHNGVLQPTNHVQQLAALCP